MRLRTVALAAMPVALLWGLPLAAGLLAFAGAATSAENWQAALAHPQLRPALLLSLWTGTASLALSLLMAVAIMMSCHGGSLWTKLNSLAAAGIAIPHLAFAIGFGFLIMPSGIIARLLVGGDAPPPWVTTQDPWGLSLIATLALKETPFILMLMWSELSRGDFASSLAGQWRCARSLGHGPRSAWFRIVLPQLLGTLRWPLVIVWTFGATVVDVALVIGPTQPPPLAVIVWADLNNADAGVNGRGLAGAALLTLAMALAGTLAWVAFRLATPAARRWLAAGPVRGLVPVRAGFVLAAVVFAAYAAVLALLFMMSFAARWPYPEPIPETWRAVAWSSLADAARPVALSLGLAIAASGAALALAALWLETMPARIDGALTFAAIAALGLPGLVVAGGQYRLFVNAGLTGTLAGLFLAHLTATFAYVFILLRGPFRAVDPRLAAVARSLGAGPLALWWKVRLPLLRAPLASAGAVGFAVSMVQFTPAQLMSAGRFSTLPMQAVTLASGGNRALTAAHALVLAGLPALAFLLALAIGRPRWSRTWR